MQTSFDHFKIFKTRHHGIRKVPGRFGKKPAKNPKIGVYLTKKGGEIDCNFIREPLLITLEHLTPIVVELVKFWEVLERN